MSLHIKVKKYSPFPTDMPLYPLSNSKRVCKKGRVKSPSKGDNKSPEFSGYTSLKDLGFSIYLTKETISPDCFIDSNATPNTSF